MRCISRYRVAEVTIRCFSLSLCQYFLARHMLLNSEAVIVVVQYIWNFYNTFSGDEVDFCRRQRPSTFVIIDMWSCVACGVCKRVW